MAIQHFFKTTNYDGTETNYTCITEYDENKVTFFDVSDPSGFREDFEAYYNGKGDIEVIRLKTREPVPEHALFLAPMQKIAGGYLQPPVKQED